ncbi:tyrosine recombinase XerC [Fructobacillus ficulneus]|uniref:Tyrosine recombinase XerC n=1 Tax=Fructobacillus ficulneus TaxID=157463 RepID=A0A0K8MIP0_9LACO|nr:tyrosine recombinase XerC [Fructobacillus ficulneus]GAP00432.1 site-specific recombinase XerD [Fructobacillus ficulneus]
MKTVEEQQYQQYLEAERGYSDQTVKAYLKDIAAFRYYLDTNGGFDGFTKVKTLEVRLYLADLYNQVLARTTIARKISSLKNFYAYLVSQKVSLDNPFEGVALRRHQAHLPEFFYDNEIQELFKAAYEREEHPLWRRDAALLEVLFATGMRVSEFSNMETDQVDLKQRLILVHGKGNKDRYVPFGSYAQKALVDYLDNCRPELVARKTVANPSQNVFLNAQGGALTSAGVTYILNQLMQKTTLTGKIHPHMLRHSFATALLNRGADMRTVQELLGHANLSTTQIYTHVSKAMLQSSYQSYFPRAKR